MSFFSRAVDVAHTLVRSAVREGDVAVDATVGNGYDTLFLCRLVGNGRVYGFDVQQEAIAAARIRLEEAGLADRATLMCIGHERMRDVVPEGVAAVMFNLGYLPGGDKNIITRPDTTLQAIEAALDLVRPGGVITIVAYPGHSGGSEEANAVVEFARSMPQRDYVVMCWQQLNTAGNPPFVVGMTKRI